MSSPLTANGAIKLGEQLKNLKSEDRPRIIEAIAEARAHGDLSENAEYHAAREQQSLIERRIALLESTLADAQIIDVKNINADNKVVFGATVTLTNLTDNKKVTYQIVGQEEASVEHGLISVSSPVARAMIGKEEGDVIEVNTPGGLQEYEIIEIKYI